MRNLNDIFRHNESIVEYIREVTKEILKEQEHYTNCPSVYRGTSEAEGVPSVARST